MSYGVTQFLGSPAERGTYMLVLVCHKIFFTPSFLNAEGELMNETELRKWRLRMNVGATSPATSSAANENLTSSRELDDLFELTVLTAQENDWEPPTREEFEARYRKEVAARNSKVSEQ